MRNEAIRVVPDDPTDPLDPQSRINFGGTVTVQHNVKVRAYGQVHPASMRALHTQFGNVWFGEDAASAFLTEPRYAGPARGASQRRSAPPAASVIQARDSAPIVNMPTVPVGQPPAAGRPRAGTRESGPISGSQQVPQSLSRQAGQASASNPGSMGPGAPSYPNAMALMARQAQDAYQRLLNARYTREQAFEAMIGQLMAATPGMSRAQAEASVRARLAYRPTPS